MRNKLDEMCVPIMKFAEFRSLKDSTSSSKPGEGMSCFNDTGPVTTAFAKGKTKECRLIFLQEASNLYRLALAAMHLAGGPSPRGNEEAVTRLLNSSTELIRNVQVMAETIGVENGYAKCGSVILLKCLSRNEKYLIGNMSHASS